MRAFVLCWHSGNASSAPAHRRDKEAANPALPHTLHFLFRRTLWFVSKKLRTHTHPHAPTPIPHVHTHTACCLSITATIAAAAAIYVPYYSRPLWHNKPPPPGRASPLLTHLRTLTRAGECHSGNFDARLFVLPSWIKMPPTQLAPWVSPASLQSVFSYRVYPNSVAHCQRYSWPC